MMEHVGSLTGRACGTGARDYMMLLEHSRMGGYLEGNNQLVS